MSGRNRLVCLTGKTFTLTEAQAKDIRDLLEVFACHSIDSWQDAIGESIDQAEFDALKERFVKATHALGGNEDYETIANRVR